MSLAESEFREIKTVISSLLISNPNKSTVSSLNNDFRQLNGYDIPFKMFGYPTLEAFLRSIPDTLNVLGSGPHAPLQVFVSSKVAHIDSMIAKQKNTSKNKNARNRSSRFINNCTVRSAPRQISSPLRKGAQSSYSNKSVVYTGTISRPPCDISKASEISTPKPLMGIRVTVPVQFVESKKRTLTPRIESHSEKPNEVEPLVNSLQKSSDHPNLTNGSTSAVSIKASRKQKLESACNNSRSYVLQYNKSSNPSSSYNNTLDRLVNLKIDSSSATENLDFKVPHEVQNHLLQIVREHANGINCSLLPSLYRKRYNAELDYCKYGYRNLIQMIKDFPNTYHCIRPDCGDYKIFDKSKPLPKNFDSKVKTFEEKPKEIIGKKYKFGNSALPEDLYRSHMIEYPPDVVKLHETIPREFLSEATVESSEVELHVGEVYDPSKFWVILEENYHDLEELMTELQSHYSSECHKLHIKEDYVDRGMFCVALYETQFHRVLVSKVDKNTHKASVFYVDYGTVAMVDSRELYFLHTTFSYLPQQAIRARLAGVLPKIEQSPWPIEVNLRFLKLVQCRSLLAKIVRINREEQVVDVVLIYKDKSQHVINDILVKEDLACTSQVSNKCTSSLYIPSVNAIHLYPSFEELENYSVPSLTDFKEKVHLGLTHEFVYPQFYKLQNECPEEEKPPESVDVPVRRRQHLQEIYLKLKEQETTENEPSVVVPPKVLKPPPGFASLPMDKNFFIQQFINDHPGKLSPDSSVIQNLHENVDYGLSQFKVLSSFASSSFTPVAPNIHSTPITTKNNFDIAMKPPNLTRNAIVKKLTEVLKAGNVVVVYCINRFLHEFLIATSVTESLIKYLKKHYLEIPSDVLEDMIFDLLEYLNHYQLSKLCDNLECIVPELKEYNLSSESLFPASSKSSETCSMEIQYPSTNKLSLSNPDLLCNANLELNNPLSYSNLSALAPSFYPHLPSTEFNSYQELSSIASTSYPNLSPPTSPNLIQTSLANLSPETVSISSTCLETFEPIDKSSMYDYEAVNSETPHIIIPKNQYVFKKKLHGKVVHLVNLNERVYIPITEMRELIKLRDVSVEILRKNIKLNDCSQYLRDADVSQTPLLGEELERSGIKYENDILSLIVVEYIPDFVKLFANVVFPKLSFEKFLKEIYAFSDKHYS